MAKWKRIVVGVDGSDGSRAALQWAFELAQEQGSELLLVSVWTPPPTQITKPRRPSTETQSIVQPVPGRVGVPELMVS
jgi:nucleotide-binding universal stress UspA family protein